MIVLTACRNTGGWRNKFHRKHAKQSVKYENYLYHTYGFSERQCPMCVGHFMQNMKKWYIHEAKMQHNVSIYE